MSGISELRGSLRWPSRREGISLALLILFVAVVEPLEPYDLLQRAVSAVVNTKSYEGDGVVIAIDAKTERELPNRVWSKSNLADLLEELSKNSPQHIVIAQQNFEEDSQADSSKLISVLSTLRDKPAWQIDLAPEEAREASRETRAIPEGEMADPSRWIESEIAEYVTPSVSAFRIRYVSAWTPYRYQTGSGVVLSTASILLGETTRPETNEFAVDSSYDPRTVPRLSAIDVLNGRHSASSIEGKNVIIAFTDRLGRDTIVTPHDPYSSRAALTIIAAETLIDGPPVSIGWLPAFLVAALASFFWMVLPRPYGRSVALVSLIAIVISPILLERYLVFQSTSNGITLILMLGIGRIWQRGRAAIDVYRSAAETKSQFLAQASHDLRQPIHAIGLLADRLSQTELSADQQQIVSKISWSVDNARRMFRALLDIAAIESGTLQAEMSSVSVNELLAEVDSQNALAAEQANVDLRLVPSDLFVRTDRALIGTMLQNLVSNAIRYSPGGRIVVGCRRKGDKLSFAVADNGRGISPDELENVQKEFYRTAKRSNLSTVNKGLGLAIVNRLADILGLRFELQSELGKGTAGYIHGVEVVSASAIVSSATPDTKLPLAGLRVVLADDDQETLDSTSEVLQRWGCQIAAFPELPRNLPKCDVILSDFDFGFGGTLAERTDVFANIEEMRAKLIIVSGHHSEQIRELIPEHSGLILTKPLRAAQLRSALMSIRTTVQSD